MSTSEKKAASVEKTTALTVASTPGYLALEYRPHDLREMLNDCLEGGLQESDLEQIKIPTGGGIQWELPTAAGGEMVATFDGVIVGIQSTRTYWPESFTGASVPPSCTSRDGKTGVGDPGGECDYCPMMQWGSGKNGTGTACSERKRVYILRPEGLLPMILNLPATSITNLRKYQVSLISQRTHPNVVVTRFGLFRTKSKAGIQYSQATFIAISPLPAEQVPLAKAYAKMIQEAVGIQSSPAPARVRANVAPDESLSLGSDGIPESDPPFGAFVNDARAETDEIPFVRADMWTELPGALAKKVL